MNTTTLDISNMLVDAGIEKDKADPLAKAILGRAEAKEVLATKHDMYLMALTIVSVNLAGTAVLLQLFLANSGAG